MYATRSPDFTPSRCRARDHRSQRSKNCSYVKRSDPSTTASRPANSFLARRMNSSGVSGVSMTRSPLYSDRAVSSNPLRILLLLIVSGVGCSESSVEPDSGQASDVGSELDGGSDLDGAGDLGVARNETRVFVTSLQYDGN